MKYSKWIGIASVVLVYLTAYQPWIHISSINKVITGMNTAGTNFGRPAMINLLVSAVAALLFYLPVVIAKRANLFVCALNLAWSIRNYIILSTCSGGECPEKLMGLYLLVAASLVMVVAALFPDIKLKEEKPLDPAYPDAGTPH